MPSSGPDFRSMLATFQAATGTNKDKEQPSHKNNNDSAAAYAAASTGTSTKLSSLKELTDRMWRVAQIKAATKISQAPSRNEEVRHSKPIRLAICFCIVDQFPHEHIWKRWISSGTNGAGVSADLFIHAKEPEKIKSEWLKEKLISKTYRPNWNDVRIVRALLKLMEEALQPHDNHNNSNDTQPQQAITHILFATESCIPICTLDDLALHLQKGISYMNYYGREKATRFDEQSVWNILEKDIPCPAIHKALPGWCVLSAHHAQAILDMSRKHLEGQDLWPAFENVWAPEEVFFPTALCLLGFLTESETYNHSMTHTEFNLRARDHQDRAHPKFWDDEFDERLVQYLRREKQCLFLRKVKHGIPLHRWERAVMTTRAASTELPVSSNVEDHERGEKRKHTSTNRNYEDHYHQNRRREDTSRGRRDHSNNNNYYRPRSDNDYYRRQYDDPPSNRRRRY
mmetsp:Transcript_9701/g.14899  ORF Transcript_9701/g.14899 Transcript_9701/m.14899 type:complete len:456 (-) Transcript_9701:129-1496(-)